MATNYTTNYQLNQWEPADAVQRVEFNADNAKVDAALKSLSDQVVQKANQSALNTLISSVNQKADASTVSSLSSLLNSEISQRQEADSSLQSALTLKGNCQFYTTSYVGQGRFGPSERSSLSFDHKPYLILIYDPDDRFMLHFRSFPCCLSLYGSQLSMGTTIWQEKGIRWYLEAGAHVSQMDMSGVTYRVLALLAADE